MKQTYINTLIALGIILVACCARWLPHPPNFTPILAMALFAGTSLQKSHWAYALPLITMCISDLFLGLHSTLFFVYLSVLGIVWIGQYYRLKPSFIRLGGSSLFASVLFYVITNFGVWLVTGLYPHSLTGILQCYVAAIPFFHNTLLSTLLYLGLFSIGYRFITSIYSRYSTKAASVNHIHSYTQH